MGDWVGNHPFKMSLLVSIFISGFAMLFHNICVKPTDLASLLLWIPLYVSPTFAIAGLSYLSEKKEVRNNGNN